MPTLPGRVPEVSPELMSQALWLLRSSPIFQDFPHTEHLDSETASSSAFLFCLPRAQNFMSPYVSQSAASTSSSGVKFSYLLLFAKSSGAITHVHNGPETTGLGDEAQSADRHGWPGLLELPHLLLRQLPQLHSLKVLPVAKCCGVRTGACGKFMGQIPSGWLGTWGT